MLQLYIYYIMNYKNIPIFVSHLGCPNDCVFCNQKKISGVSEPYNIAECEKIIEEALKYMKNSSENTEIAFFGGSFTGIPIEQQKEYLNLAHGYVKSKKVAGIRLSTRPDYINAEILDLLKQYGVTTIELGVQSMSDHVLELNKRGMTTADTLNAVKEIRKYGFALGIQMMTSMYGSNNDTDIFTAKEIIKLKPDFARIYPTVVIEDTELYELYKNEKYQTKTLDETVALCAEIYKLFKEADIPIIRLGLMSSDEINTDKVIGAYHPAFGELVMAKYYYNLIMEKIGDSVGDTLIIEAPAALFSKISGHKKENTEKFLEKFKQVKLIVSNQFKITVL